ncbi:MAG: hypothetical protein H6937_00040 [Burkholderiales bacterium]|nr:hypothetical protein [Burkholderiales bacterium]MDR4518483.1 hypothetical protein [Nitrosomonas sp.]
MLRVLGHGASREHARPIFHVLALAWYKASNSERPVVVDGFSRYKTEAGITAHFDPLAQPERRLIPDGELGQQVLAETNYYHKTMRYNLHRKIPGDKQ